MRAAYLDDLRSKFLLENSVLKMEYAEVRVLHLAHKVGRAHTPSPPSPRWPASLFLRTWQCLCLLPGPQPRHSPSPALPSIAHALLDISSLAHLCVSPWGRPQHLTAEQFSEISDQLLTLFPL